MQQPPNQPAMPMGASGPTGPSGPLPTPAADAGTGTGTPLWSPPARTPPHGPTAGPDDATRAFTTTGSSAGGASPPPTPTAEVLYGGTASGSGRSEDAGRSSTSGGGKRLYRKTQNKLFLGVCSGLAEYFDMDATLMRIIFVCASLFVGTGLVLYLVLALVMPAEESLDLDPRIAAQQTVDEAVNEVKRGVDMVTTKARDMTGRNKAQEPGSDSDPNRPPTTY